MYLVSVVGQNTVGKVCKMRGKDKAGNNNMFTYVRAYVHDDRRLRGGTWVFAYGRHKVIEQSWLRGGGG